MRKIISAALALAMAATSAVAFTGESEARRGYRNYDRYERHYHHNGYYNRGYYGHRRHHHGNEAAAAIAGLALGAIIVGSTQNSYRYGYRGSSHVERCERTYRSYDRGTDTFIGRDGREYYCNL